jgi:MFS family permease
VLSMIDATMAGAAARRSRHALPAWWPARWYYGWVLVGALGLTATVSYGILSYGFAAFITPMGAELGWSKAQLTGAFSLAQLVAGAAAIPVGHWVDRHGARGLMTAGSLLATALLVAWSRVTSLPAFYALWALMGVAMAAVLYEPAFVVIATWFRSGRSRALTVLTFLGGFASVVFVPLATVLVARQGWRDALLTLAALHAALTVVPHALLLRRRPEDVGLAPDGAGVVALDARKPESAHVAGATAAAREAIRGPAFRWIAVAFTLAGLTTTAVSVHLVPLLLERGHGAGFAGAAMGLLGLMALPGRLIFTPLGGRWSRGAVTASIFALSALALAVLLTTRSAVGVWVFVALFGAGFGAITPARAALVGDLVPAAVYGRVSGRLALIVSLARAAAPVGASLLYTAGGGSRHGYDTVLVALLVLCVTSGVAILAADASARSRASRGPGTPGGTQTIG